MTAKLSQPWISAARVESLVQIEPALAILGLVIIAWLLKKTVLRRVSEERHRNLNRHLSNLALHLTVAVSSFALYYYLSHVEIDGIPIDRVVPYIGLLSVLSWSVVFVKASRLLLLEYLFIKSMRVGVPLLLVNIFSLFLTLVIAGWLATELFNFQIGPLLATSAIFSVVLGFALQDTLGNLFAGLAMQFDKPYEIGDWIEIVLEDMKWAGRVEEISWRATVLVAMTEEVITIPNRLMGQTQVSNFSSRRLPIIRSQVFRLPLNVSIERTHALLNATAARIPEILQNPRPFSYVLETKESWLTFKVVYYIDDYGKQFIIGDRVITAVTQALREDGIELAADRIVVLRDSESVHDANQRTVSADV